MVMMLLVTVVVEPHSRTIIVTEEGEVVAVVVTLP